MFNIALFIYNSGNISNFTTSRSIKIYATKKDGTQVEVSGTSFDMTDVVYVVYESNASYTLTITFSCI